MHPNSNAAPQLKLGHRCEPEICSRDPGKNMKEPSIVQYMTYFKIFKYISSIFQIYFKHGKTHDNVWIPSVPCRLQRYLLSFLPKPIHVHLWPPCQVIGQMTQVLILFMHCFQAVLTTESTMTFLWPGSCANCVCPLPGAPVQCWPWAPGQIQPGAALNFGAWKSQRRKHRMAWLN